MDKFFLFLLTSLIFIDCNNIERKEYYHNGELKSLIKLNFKGHDSIKKLFYKNGKLKEIIIFDDGKKYGTQKEYYKDGALKQKILHDSLENKKIYFLYYKNGSLKRKTLTLDTNTVFVEEFNRNGELIFEMRKMNTIVKNDTIYKGDTVFINIIPYGSNLDNKRFINYVNANLIKFNANALKKSNSEINRYSFGRKGEDSFSLNFSNPTKNNKTKIYTFPNSKVKEKVSHIDSPKVKFHFIPVDTGKHVLYGSYAVYLNKSVAKNFKNNILSYPFKVEFNVEPSKLNIH